MWAPSNILQGLALCLKMVSDNHMSKSADVTKLVCHREFRIYYMCTLLVMATMTLLNVWQALQLFAHWNGYPNS
jgi:hypothetical protein